jgi:hypothetical protein
MGSLHEKILIFPQDGFLAFLEVREALSSVITAEPKMQENRGVPGPRLHGCDKWGSFFGLFDLDCPKQWP